jgi:perosamine synthetase
VNNQIPLSKPDITNQDIEAVTAVLRTDRLSIGPRLEAFEAAAAALAGRRFGIGVNSGTSGLHLCVRALGLHEGDEVITTPFSFVATTNCLLFERVTPVFVDIDLTYNMDPSLIEAAITPRTTAILPAEIFGNTAHFDQYEAIARKHKLLMLEDCCEAVGGKLRGRPAGSFGDCGVFAFYPNKQITTGEGGMVVTDRQDIAEMCRALRNHGRTNDAATSFEHLGYNYRMSELTAALGLAQIGRLEGILQKRREVAAAYHEALKGVDEVVPPPHEHGDGHSWFVYVIRLSDRFTAYQRDRLRDLLRKGGVDCGDYFSPLHLAPYISRVCGGHAGQFPVTESVAQRTLALPFFTNMSRRQVQAVVDSLKAGLRQVRNAPSAC